MRAICYDRFGGPEVLRLADLPDPSPGPGEVLIRVRAASVNPIDWKIAEGYFADALPHVFPIVPGWDAAGEVAALGAGVAGFAAGDRVFAYCQKPEVSGGTYAGLVTMPAAAVAPMPEGIDFAPASAIPLTGLTAWQALVEFAGLAAGQSVLIHAGAGGVGSLAVQIAAARGAEITATCGPANSDYVRALGARHAVDYRAADAPERLRAIAPEGFDTVFDTVGGATLEASYALVRRGGALPALNDAPDAERCTALGIRGLRLFSRPDGAQLREIGVLLASGKLRPPEIEILPLERAAEAFARSRAGHVRGKLVLNIG